MSGHSKWSTIKRQKGVADIKRGQTFTKVANAITLAVKLSGSGDPNSNPRLRTVLDEAREVNMPKDNIQRAVDRGLGKLPGQSIEEVTYEGFGPGKTAFFIEGVTDNKLRTLQEIKNLFERAGGSLGVSGSTAYLFIPKGEIRALSKGGSSEDEMLELIDLGAEDVEDYMEPLDSFDKAQDKSAQGHDIQKYLVYTPSSELNTMGNKITQVGYRVESQELVMKPIILQPINDKETAQKAVEFTERLEENDDIQKVYTNFDIEESLIT